MRKYHDECKENEVFVGNTEVEKSREYLKGVNYRLGNQAYDYYGKKIPTDYMLPLYISKGDFDKYNSIMEESCKEK